MNLPKSAEVNRFVAKKKFYEHSNMAESIKNSFVNDLEKITWSYKLSEDTMNLSKTDIVNEIEIFTLNVTKKNIPNSIIKTINKLIPYKILFKIVFENNYCYAIYEKETIYNTEWNENLDFKFNGLNLENVWNNIIKHIINEDNNDSNIENILDKKKKLDELVKEIEKLENKIKKEKQFNRKVELNQILIEKQNELEALRNEQIRYENK